MITEQQQEQAALCALGLLGPDEQQQFAGQLRTSPELAELFHGLQRALDSVVLSLPGVQPPPRLKEKILARIQARPSVESSAARSLPAAIPPGLHFVAAMESTGWKQLPIPGAEIKLLSFEPNRGYAVLMGRLAPGAHYPAHTNAGPEDFYILTGDLHVGNRILGPGDFHHADAGSAHEENYSVEGCTLLAVLTVDDPLVAFARS